MRDYDPTTGRYMQADPLGLVDGASVYGYAGQSPQVNADPTGLCWNIHSNACKAVNKARFNATLAAMNAYTAANAGYAVGMAGADGCITADEAMGVVSAVAFGAAGLGIGKLLGVAVKSSAFKAFLRDEAGSIGSSRWLRGTSNRSTYEIEVSNGITRRNGHVTVRGDIRTRTDFEGGVPIRRVDFDHTHGNLGRGHVNDLAVNPFNHAQVNVRKPPREPMPGEYLSPVLSNPKSRGGTFRR